jgi:hypothetical protein
VAAAPAASRCIPPGLSECPVLRIDVSEKTGIITPGGISPARGSRSRAETDGQKLLVLPKGHVIEFKARRERRKSGNGTLGTDGTRALNYGERVVHNEILVGDWPQMPACGVEYLAPLQQ